MYAMAHEARTACGARIQGFLAKLAAPRFVRKWHKADYFGSAATPSAF
jgi:hypothetical protein